MAEILIRAVDNTSGHIMAWKRGMPVVVFENGHPWGAQEVIPPAQGGKFVILKITDVTVAQVNNFLQNRWGIDLCDEEMSVVTVLPEAIRRRVVNLRVSDLPANVRQQLNNNGSFSTTWPNVKSFWSRITTGEAF